ncbi:MAG: DUF6049 family protein [Ruaniaceae bacterium]|nr:DUF6049 family protein [Ruaniaceae bacterium]
MNPRRRVAAATALSALAALLFAGTAGAAEATLAPRALGADVQPTATLPAIDVEITGIEPLVLMTGDTATITGVVTNTTREAIENVTVRLNAQGWTPNSRSTLLNWLDPTRYDPAHYLDREIVDELDAGATAIVTFEVPATDFAFNTWGPRGIELVARADGAITDQERSFVLWWNDPSVAPTRVGVLAPVTQTASELQSGSTARLDDLATLDETPGLTLLVDPSHRTGPLFNAAALPWLNADAEALLVGDPDAYAAAMERSAAAKPGMPVVTWLADPSANTLAASASMSDAVLVPSDAVSGATGLGDTPNALVESAAAPIVVIDSGLTEVLTGHASDDATTFTLNETEQRQLLAAVTSVITRESPLESRTALGAFDADVTRDGTAVSDVLVEVPWVEPVTLEEVLARTPAALTLDLPEEVELPAGAISLEELESAAEVRTAVADLSTLAPEVEARLASTLTSLDTLTSRALRDDPAARTRTLARAAWLIDYYQGGVTVTGPSEVNMISSESEFPVIITNSLPHAVTVSVALTPTDRRLQSAENTEVEIPATTTTRVTVPVKGVGWGDFEAAASVSTATGRSLSDSYIIEVRLRANWEDWGLIAIIALAVAALAFGIWRTVRRNRRINRSEIIDAAAAELDAVLEAERTGRRSSRREP